jgi:hypothetical protein
VISRLAASTASTVATSVRFCAIVALAGRGGHDRLVFGVHGGGQRAGDDERRGDGDQGRLLHSCSWNGMG